ncbi:MAG: tetratricopeptide repeat protein [Planctomycetota bacterium]|nr:tetratricopeptide repeat protein [Planctomycetota bacterium]
MDVEKFITRATQSLRKRNPDQAIALFRQVLVAKPGHPQARGGLLAAYRRKAELKGGTKWMGKAAAGAARAAAMSLRGGNRPEALVKACDAGLEKNPEDLVLVELMAEAYEQLGHQGAALAVWSYRLENDDQDTGALKAAGKLHWALRQIDEALDCLERAHRIDPRDPETEKLRKNLVAEGTLKTTKYETAASSHELIRDKETLQGMEKEQRRHRSVDELADDLAGLRTVFDQDPAADDVRRQLVKALARAGEYDEALKLLDDVIATHPDDEAWQDVRGDVALANNEAQLKSARGDNEAKRRLQEERSALEVEEYSRRVDRDPADSNLRVRLARALYRTGEVDRAIESFQVAVKDPRNKLDAQQGLGACFYKKGLYPLAARQFEAALEAVGGIEGDHGKEICYHLGLVCERQKDHAAALSRYLQIYEIDISYKDVATKIEELKNESD